MPRATSKASSCAGHGTVLGGQSRGTAGSCDLKIAAIQVRTRPQTASGQDSLRTRDRDGTILTLPHSWC